MMDSLPSVSTLADGRFSGLVPDHQQLMMLHAQTRWWFKVRAWHRCLAPTPSSQQHVPHVFPEGRKLCLSTTEALLPTGFHSVLRCSDRSTKAKGLGPRAAWPASHFRPRGPPQRFAVVIELHRMGIPKSPATQKWNMPLGVWAAWLTSSRRYYTNVKTLKVPHVVQVPIPGPPPKVITHKARNFIKRKGLISQITRWLFMCAGWEVDAYQVVLHIPLYIYIFLIDINNSYTYIYVYISIHLHYCKTCIQIYTHLQASSPLPWKEERERPRENAYLSPGSIVRLVTLD